MSCPKCRKQNKDDADFCIYCGTALRKEARIAGSDLVGICCICGNRLLSREIQYESWLGADPFCSGCLGRFKQAKKELSGKSHAQILLILKRERAQARVKEEQEQARLKAEQDAREKARQEAYEKAEQEARDRENLAREAYEKGQQELRETREKADEEERMKAEQERIRAEEARAREKAEQEARKGEKGQRGFYEQLLEEVQEGHAKAEQEAITTRMASSTASDEGEAGEASGETDSEAPSPEAVAALADAMKTSLARVKELADIQRIVVEAIKAIQTTVHDLAQEDNKGFWSRNDTIMSNHWMGLGKSLWELSQRLDTISITSSDSANSDFAAALADALSQADRVCMTAAQACGIPAYSDDLLDSIHYIERLEVTLLRTLRGSGDAPT